MINEHFCPYICVLNKKKMSSKAKIKAGDSTEDKIKSAARRLFTKEGYEAVKTRDIAKEAGINLALLNYYFRSKEKLFEIIMFDNLQQFFQEVTAIVNDGTTAIEKKIELLVDFYITNLSKTPYIPLFVLNQAQNNPTKLHISFNLNNSCFMKQFEREVKAKRMSEINSGHLMMNILGLAIFPFAARPLIQKIRGVSDEEFNALMLERKKLIPQWIKSMLETNKSK